MPRQNKLSSFGPEWEALLTRAYDALRSGQPEFAVDFADPKSCHSVRFRMYAYMKALRESTSRPDLTAMQTNLSMRAGNCTLFFYRPGDDLDAKAIRAALQLPDGFADGPSPIGISETSSTLNSNLSRLRAMRTQSEKK